MPGKPLPGTLALLQRLFTWWLLALFTEFALGLLLPRMEDGGAVGRRNASLLGTSSRDGTEFDGTTPQYPNAD